MNRHQGAAIAGLTHRRDGKGALGILSSGVQQPVRTLIEVEAQKRYFGILPVAAQDIMAQSS